MKFENWKTAFRNFGKFEKQSSKFWNIRKIGREQMNEAMKLTSLVALYCINFHISQYIGMVDATSATIPPATPWTSLRPLAVS